MATAQDAPTPPAPASHNVGEAEIALQGYYLGGNSQQLIDTSGVALTFREFIGGFGLVSGSLQGYGSQGDLRMGDNFLDLQQLALLGHHLRFTGGDFHISPNLVENPFNNIYNPEIAARGFRMEVSRENQTFGFYVGDETLQDGPRVTFRVPAPQSVIGVFGRQQFGERLQVGMRYLHLSSSESDIEGNPFLFPVGRQFRSVDSASAQSVYSFTKLLKFYGETTLSSAAVSSNGNKLGGGPASILLGPAWESPRVTVRSNYTYQTASYFPVLGYFAGDRRGPFAEARYRATKSLEFSASTNHYSNNLANDPAVAQFRSSAYSAGSSVSLPWKLSASGNFSVIRFLSSTPNTGLQQDSKNRQLLLTLTRPIQHHHLRFSYMDLKLDSTVMHENQRSMEAEDTFIFKRMVLGGAVRTQTADASESHSTVFFRGSAQLNFRRISAYGYIEKGNDLLNHTLFATNSYSSTVVGLTAPIARGWSLQAEIFRNQLNTQLNPENIFVMQSQGIPVVNTLSAFNQWSTYFRLSKQLHWGGNLPGEGWEHYAAIHNPLVGSVEGVVAEQRLAGNRGVEGIPVSLDGSRTAITDIDGHYRFGDVPEGFHRIALAMQELPADFETGTVIDTHVKVEPRNISRADLNVVRLTSFSGKIVAPQGIAVDGVVIRLLNSSRYTTPDPDGNFTFYNLREGDYELVVDENTLPEGCVMLSPAQIPIAVRLDSTTEPARFEIGLRKVEKPVRIMIEQQIDLRDAGNGVMRGGSGGRQ